MRILFNDIIQYSDATENLKSPLLSEITEINNTLTINLNEPRQINSVGIGNVDNEDTKIYDGWKADAIYNDVIDGGKANTSFTDILESSRFKIVFNDIRNTEFTFYYNGSGLYVMPKTITASRMTINTKVKIIGRIGAGIAINIPTSIAKEPTYCSTSSYRKTLSGQIIIGAGGYNYRQVSLDSRYKIDSLAMREIENGRKYIGLGYPFFIDLKDENYKLPFSKFYGIDSNQQKLGFESGIKKYLYSRRFDFTECF
jgi:hypothetical protein